MTGMPMSIKKLAGVIAVAMALFHMYTGGMRLLPGMQQRAVHLAFALALIFLLYPEGQGKEKGVAKRVFNFAFALCGLIAGGYVYFQYEPLSFRVGSPNNWDIIVGLTLIILVLEASRRMLGWALPITAMVFLAYAAFGSYLPVIVRHSGYSFERIVTQVALTPEGIFGIALGVSASYVALFVILGAFLEEFQAGQLFINIALSLFGKMRGGPAKAAIGASSLFGMISGSQVANVVSTGVLTIPLMQRVGYKPEFAGAVEAAASTGGMFLPPVMGATAFLIAEVLQVHYFDVAAAAIIPALLYYVTLFIIVHLRAVKRDLKGIETDGLGVKSLIKQKGHLLIPLLVLCYFLFVTRESPSKAAFWSVISCPLACMLRSNTRLNFRTVLNALIKGARLALVVASATATAGIIIGVINLSGLGLRLSGILIDLAGGNLFLLLILTMLSSIVLGMGLPPVASYIVLAVLAAPALVNLGVEPMAAHLFIFFFGTISAVTPPVALAAYAAAGVAKSNPTRTGLVAFRLTLAAFIIPYMFVYGPALIFKGSAGEIVMAVISALIGVTALAIALEGYLKEPVQFISRLLYFAAALLLIKVGFLSDVIGFAVFVLVTLYEVKWHGLKEMKETAELTN